MNTSHREVLGFCPACGHDALFLGAGGRVTCSRLTCPRPSAADEILDDRETGHIVNLTHNDFSLVHPLIERLDGQLLDCDLSKYLTSLMRAPAEPGRYRATGSGQKWTWEPLG